MSSSLNEAPFSRICSALALTMVAMPAAAIVAAPDYQVETAAGNTVTTSYLPSAALCNYPWSYEGCGGIGIGTYVYPGASAPGFTGSAANSSSDLTGQATASMSTATGQFSGYGQVFRNNAMASADLAMGILSGYAATSGVAAAHSFSFGRDTLHCTIPGGNVDTVTPITVTWTFSGEIHLSEDGSSYTSYGEATGNLTLIQGGGTTGVNVDVASHFSGGTL